MAVKYDKLFAESWRMLIKHKILFVPNVFLFLFSFLLFIIYLIVSGILSLLIKNPAMIYDQRILHEQIRFLAGTYPVKEVICLLGYFVVVILTDLFFVTMKYGMIKDIITKRKTSLHEGYIFARHYYMRSAYVHIMSFLMIYTPLIITGVVFYILAQKTNSFPLMTPWIIIAIILLLVFVYIIYMLIRLFYIYPIMTFEEAGALKTIEKDFHYVKTHVGHTMMTWILFAVVWFLYVVLRTPLGRLASTAQNIFIVAAVSVLVLFFNFIISIWEHIFIFKSYFEGSKTQKRKVFKEDDSWKSLYK